MNHLASHRTTICSGTTLPCREYASVGFISAADEGSFDYIAVDGRSRMLCLKRALKLLKPEVLPSALLHCDQPRKSHCDSNADSGLVESAGRNPAAGQLRRALSPHFLTEHGSVPGLLAAK
jgi:hypothetical protein